MGLLQYHHEGVYLHSEGRKEAFEEKEGHYEQDKVCLVLLEKVL